MEIRKFECKDGQMVMVKNHCTGEFFHENDIKLYLMDMQRGLNAQINLISKKCSEDEMGEWDKKYKYGLEEQLALIENLLNTFK